MSTRHPKQASLAALGYGGYDFGRPIVAHRASADKTKIFGKLHESHERPELL
jgi:hypothetical protein